MCQFFLLTIHTNPAWKRWFWTLSGLCCDPSACWPMKVCVPSIKGQVPWLIANFLEKIKAKPGEASLPKQQQSRNNSSKTPLGLFLKETLLHQVSLLHVFLLWRSPDFMSPQGLCPDDLTLWNWQGRSILIAFQLKNRKVVVKQKLSSQ